MDSLPFGLFILSTIIGSSISSLCILTVIWLFKKIKPVGVEITKGNDLDVILHNKKLPQIIYSQIITKSSR